MLLGDYSFCILIKLDIIKPYGNIINLYGNCFNKKSILLNPFQFLSLMICYPVAPSVDNYLWIALI